MEKEVGNATSACKVLHVLYTPPPAFCKPPTPIFFAKLAELTSKHLFLSGSVNASPHNQSICIHLRTTVGGTDISDCCHKTSAHKRKTLLLLHNTSITAQNKQKRQNQPTRQR